MLGYTYVLSRYQENIPLAEDALNKLIRLLIFLNPLHESTIKTNDIKLNDIGILP